MLLRYLKKIFYNSVAELRINKRYMSNLNRIKVVLVEQKKTGKWLADQLGKSTCTVSKWCQNTTQPDLLTLEQIAQLLEVDIRDLLVGTKLTTTSKY